MARSGLGIAISTAAPVPRQPTAPGPLRWSELAWIASVPCAIVVALAIVLLGPGLGRLLFPSSSIVFFTGLVGGSAVRPEPTEHARFLIALSAPLLLIGLLAAAARHPLSLKPLVARTLTQVAQGLCLAFLIISIGAQRTFTYSTIYSNGPPFHRAYFTPATLVATLLITTLFVVVIHIDPVRAQLDALLRELPQRRRWVLVIAVSVTALALLPAVLTEGVLATTNRGVLVNLPWSLDETFAVLDGRSPLVNFASQYGQLWPYPVALVMSTFGTSVGVYTVTMAALSGGALVAIFAMLRRVVRSSALALMLYLPFLATSFFIKAGPSGNRYSPENLFSVFPIRYAGPYLLVWLTARQLDGVRPRKLWTIYLVAGLVVLNNIEFGLPALAATAAALACSFGRRPSRAELWRAATGIGVGLSGAFALVAALTLARTGSLPSFARLTQFSRLFGLGGQGLLPIPPLGFHLVLYATFVAAICVAAVRVLSGEPDRLLTAMLAWSGVFGLGVGAYYAGRSHPDVLIDLFSAWALAVVLLVIVTIRERATRTGRLPALPELVVLLGLGLLLCSLPQLPTPWSQISRLENRKAASLAASVGEPFIAANTHRGESVAILSPLGHLVAYDLGLVNVSPYASIESMATPAQLSEAVRALRHAGGQAVFLGTTETLPSQLRTLAGLGYKLNSYDPAEHMTMAVAR
jgi:hypothetical protein